MTDLGKSDAKPEAPTGGGPFTWREPLIFWPGCLLLGVFVAWGADDASKWVAPLLVFPLCAGAVLGMTLALLLRATQTGNRFAIVVGLAAALCLSTVGQRYFAYRDLLAHSQNVRSDVVEQAKAAFPELADRVPTSAPQTFIEFVKRLAVQERPFLFGMKVQGASAVAVQMLELLIEAFGAALIVLPAMRMPYCSKCRSWRRTTRSLRLDPQALKAAADLCGVESPAHVKTGRCRLINCLGGCAPTGCELHWEDADGNTFFARTWLNRSMRNQISEIMDAAALQNDEEEQIAEDEAEEVS